VNTTALDYLFQVSPPWISLGIGEPERAKWIPTHFYSRPESAICVRQLRGKKMQSVATLMDEFGAALQFFDRFGENWPALKEGLCYLDEWLPADTYILVIESAEHVLARENSEQFVAFLRTLHDAGEWWSRPIVDNDRFNRPARPFHVLLNVEPADAESVDRIATIAQGAGVPVRT
jgi:hypothetical protein